MEENERNLWRRLDVLHEEIKEITEKLSCMRNQKESGTEIHRVGRFEEMLSREIQRCQRYNRYCVAAIVPATGREPSTIMQAAFKCFREMDLVDLLDGYSGSSCHPTTGDHVYLAILMPETQREGGHTAMQRALSVLQTDTGRYGLAAYPDDATNSGELLKRAMTEVECKATL